MSNEDEAAAPDPGVPTQPVAPSAPPPPTAPPPLTAPPAAPSSALPAPPMVPSRPHAGREPRPKTMTALAVAFLLTISAFVGYTMGSNHSSSSSSNASSITLPSQFPSNGQRSIGNGNGNGNTGSTRSFDASGIAAAVTPAVVNITTTLDSGEAAGTGIVISSDGLAITNNHVIADSNSVQVAIGGDDTNTHPAKVVGYDVVDDVALIKIQGVSGLDTASLGDSSTLTVGDGVIAIGNAGGRGGTPSVVTGTVTALDQQITASDEGGGNAETLDGLIQTDANIQPGDSGGPLVDTNGKVVGMDAAASSGNGGFGFGGRGGGEGYAIPIEDALAIAKKIASGDGSDTIHIGPNRGVLGVQVIDDSANVYGNGRASGSGTNGAPVQNVDPSSGAASAGIQQGDVIVGLNGKTIDSATALTHDLVGYSPKDKVQVEWIDSSGAHHQASIVLGSGPPA
jgi:S1-C subfamily serine protease